MRHEKRVSPGIVKGKFQRESWTIVQIFVIVGPLAIAFCNRVRRLLDPFGKVASMEVGS